jgi:hypothetical protein
MEARQILNVGPKATREEVLEVRTGGWSGDGTAEWV